MISIVDSPFAVFFVALIAQCGAAYMGDRLRRNVRPVKKDEREDFNTALTATLTLLALIIGFSFSMAVSRYDQRKTAKKPRPMRLARNICVQICCPPMMPQRCVNC